MAEGGSTGTGNNDPSPLPPPPPDPIPVQFSTPKRKPGCFKQCLTYGILGPHAIRFYCFNKGSVLHRESFNTKLMYLIFLGIITVLSCFFIIPYPSIDVSSVWPCRKGGTGDYYTFDGFWGNCRGHAGYFLVYRAFFAAVCVFLIISVLVIGIRNSQESCRAGIHLGYWFWKFFAFLALMIIFIFMVTLDKNAIFDEVFMFVGLVASILFSFPTLIFILDVCEVIVIRLKSKSKKWKILYWLVTASVFIIDILGLSLLIAFYSNRTSAMDLDFGKTDVAGDSGDKVCHFNAFLMAYLFGVGLFLAFVSTVRELIPHEKYLNTGFLQAAVLFGHSILSVYLALANSTDTSCRPVWYAFHYNENQLDVAFTAEGFVHAIFVWLTLGYFTLGRGPRTDSAPLSRFWLLLCCMIEKVPESVAMNEMERLGGEPVKSAPEQPLVTDMTVASGYAAEVGTETIAGATFGGYTYMGPPQSPAAWTKPAITSSQAQIGSGTGAVNGSNMALPPTISPSNQNLAIPMWGAPPARPEIEDPFKDEALQCNYSWPLFHLFLSLGALSMMMGVTNFIRPKADGPLASNLPAFITRLLISPVAVIAFVASIFVKIPIRWNWRKNAVKAEEKKKSEFTTSVTVMSSTDDVEAGRLDENRKVIEPSPLAVMTSEDVKKKKRKSRKSRKSKVLRNADGDEVPDFDDLMDMPK